MRDIVERLTDAANDIECQDGMAVMLDAKDEIEAMRQRVARLESDVEYWSDTVRKELIEYYEKELDALKHGQGEPVGWCDMGWPTSGLAYRVKPQAFPTKPLYSAPTIPEGYVIVPVEPTDEQKWKGVDVAQSFGAKVSDIYKAMLAAAPNPEE